VDSELRGRIKERLAALVKLRDESHAVAQEYVLMANKRMAILDAVITELTQLLEEPPSDAD
jgi:hypothetical protein